MTSSGPFMTEYPRLSMGIRMMGTLYANILMLYLTIKIGPKQFLYYSNWSLMLTGIALKLIIVGQKYARVNTLSAFLFPVVVINNVVVFLVFWCIIFPLEMPPVLEAFLFHSFTIFVTTFEMYIDQVKVKTKHMYAAIMILLLYLLLINIPYSVMYEPIYSFVDLNDWTAALGISLLVSVYFAIGMACISLKKKVLVNRISILIDSNDDLMIS